MPQTDLPVPDHGLIASGPEEVVSPEAAALATQIAAIFGASLLAVLHYGSRSQGRLTHPDSPYDFFVVVVGYRLAYRCAAVMGAVRSPRLAILLAHLLPPNAMAVRARGASGVLEGKCIIISRRDFERETSPRARDHFVRARMMQRVLFCWSRDGDSTRVIRQCLESVRSKTFGWAQAFLTLQFDLSSYCRALLEISLAHEVRAESREHAGVLYQAQQAWFLANYRPVLGALVAQGWLEHDEPHGLYRQRQPPGAVAKFQVRTYFRWNRARTTLRLLKHPFLYDNWLDYLLNKVRRSTGETITLSPRERRW
ncbi:MAG: hypothetical protein ABIR59_10160, partial [Gemmatimonadales bacterium]